MENKAGFALVYEDNGKYQMSTIHKTPECAITNGVSIFSDYRVVAVIPVQFEDDGYKNIHLIFGDEEMRKAALNIANHKFQEFTSEKEVEETADS